MSNEGKIYVEEDGVFVEIEGGHVGSLILSTTNHDLLENRDIANQHSIDAITGLRGKLAEIQDPVNAKSVNGGGYAEYHIWNGEKPRYDIGRFVALVDGGDNIEVVNTNNQNICGVTVSKSDVAFVGRDNWEPIIDEANKVITGYQNTIDDTYGLVCLVGNVKVRYTTNAATLDIVPGDYVKPNIETVTDGNQTSNMSGFAIKANDHQDRCYRVIQVGAYEDGYYVVINLSVSASDVKNISANHAKNADNYTEDGTIKEKFDDIDHTIEREVGYIEVGTTIAGKAKNYDETEGAIKERFENVDSRIEDIVDGTTIVAHSTATDYINVEDVKSKAVQAYDIKTCTTDDLDNASAQTSNTVYLVTDDTTIEDMEEDVATLKTWKSGVNIGTNPVAIANLAYKARQDELGSNIFNYYNLGVNSRKVVTFDSAGTPSISNLDLLWDGGSYMIDVRYKDKVRNLPISVLETDARSARLIVEATKQEDRDGNKITYLRQIVNSCTTSSDGSLKSFNTETRFGALYEDNTYVWSSWDLVPTLRDLQTDFTAPKAQCDDNGVDIANNYAQKSNFQIISDQLKVDAKIGSIFTLWCEVEYLSDEKTTTPGRNFQSDELQVFIDTDGIMRDFAQNKKVTSDFRYYTLSGTWKLCGLCGEYTHLGCSGRLYIIQRVA